nr:hypothetical protein [Methylobacterium sp. L1A1]
MPPRIEGPDPPARRADPWTRADVERWLKTAFRAMPYAPIYAPRGSTLQVAAGVTPDATFDLLAFSGTVLGEKSEERHILLLWARSMATGGGVGGSVSEYCLRTGRSRATFDRIRIRACERIVEAKNRADSQDDAPR